MKQKTYNNMNKPTKQMHAPGIGNGFIRTVASTWLLTVAGILISVVTARGLGLEGRGVFSAIVMIATLSSSAAQLGLANSYIYFSGAKRELPYHTVFIASLGTVTIFAPSIALLLTPLNIEPKIKSETALIVCLSAAMSAYQYAIALTQLKADLLRFNQTRITFAFLHFFLLVGLWATANLELVNLGYGQIIIYVVLVLLITRWLHLEKKVTPSYTMNEPSSMWSFFRYAVHHHGSTLTGLLITNLDKLILLRVGDMQQFGLYAVAYGTSRMIGSVQEAVSTAVFSRYAGKDVTELSAAVNNSYRFTFLPMLSIAFALAALSPWLIQFLFGSDFKGTARIFSVLCIECVVAGASWTLAQRFTASGRPGLVLLRQIITIVPIIAALPFLPDANAALALASLMLVGAALRLITTLLMFPLVFNEAIPSAKLSLNDLIDIKNKVLKTYSDLIVRFSH